MEHKVNFQEVLRGDGIDDAVNLGDRVVGLHLTKEARTRLSRVLNTNGEVDDLVFDLLAPATYFCVARNSQNSRQGNEPQYLLRFPEVATLAKVAFQALHKPESGFLITGVFLRPQHPDGTFVKVVAAVAIGRSYAKALPSEALERLLALEPEPDGEFNALVGVERWDAFLEVQRRAAEASSWKVRYSSRRRKGNTWDKIELFLEAQPDEGVTEKLAATARRRREQVRILALKHNRTENSEDDANEPGEEHAKGVLMKAVGGQLTLELAADYLLNKGSESIPVPPEGWIVYEPYGELSQIKAQQRALQSLQRGEAANPRLLSFLFGKGKDAELRPVAEVDAIEEVDCLAQGRINHEQRLAVARALAMDCFLLQGPPGTGKTTFIAELCYQIASRGQRVLVASQANLAVDNALSRLQKHPEIMAIRLGRKVTEDGEDFVGDRAVHRWLRSLEGRAEAELERLAASGKYQPFYLEHWDSVWQWVDWASVWPVSRAELRQTMDAQLTYAVNCEEKSASLAIESDELPGLIVELGRLEQEPVAAIEQAWNAGRFSALSSLWLESSKGGLNPWRRHQFTQARANAASAYLQNEGNAIARLEQLREQLQFRQSSLKQAVNDLSRALDKHFNDTAKFSTQQAAILKMGRVLRDGPVEEDIEWLFATCPLLSSQRERFDMVAHWAESPPTGTPGDTRETVAFESLVTGWLRDEMVGSFESACSLYLEIRERFKLLNNQLPGFFGKLFGTDDAKESQRRFDYAKSCTKRKAKEADDWWRSEWIEGPAKYRLLRDSSIATDRYADTISGSQAVVLGDLQELLAKERLVLDDAGKVMKGTEKKVEQLKITLKDVQSGIPEDILALSAVIETLTIELKSIFGSDADVAAVAPTDNLNAAIQVCEVTIMQARALLKDAIQLPATEKGIVKGLIETAYLQHKSILESQQREAALAAQHLKAAEDMERDIMDRELRYASVAENWEFLRRTGHIPVEFSKELPTKKDLWIAQDQWASGVPPDRDARESILLDWLARLQSEEQSDAVDPALLQLFVAKANVIGSTCLGVANFKVRSLLPAQFDYVIVDEVSKATPTELLLPCLRGRNIVLVGDHKQLPPIFGDESSFAEAAEQLGDDSAEFRAELETSLFKERFEFLQLQSSPRVLPLVRQYRMHSQIMRGINQFYNYELELGEPDQDEGRGHGLSCGTWLTPDRHLVWINIPYHQDWGFIQEGNGRYNPHEAKLVGVVLRQLEEALQRRCATGAEPLDLGVTAVYNAQVRELRKEIPPQISEAAAWRLNTVDQFQGMEKDIMVVSLVMNRNKERPEETVPLSKFLQKPERINVAMSRARRLLIVVGCSYSYTRIPCEASGAYAQIFDLARRHGAVIEATHVLD